MIGVTGSLGKSSTTGAVVTVLESEFTVFQTIGDYNTELGLLCSLFHQKSGFGSIRRWLRVVIGATWNRLTDHSHYDKLVLEMAANAPGRMTETLTTFRPEIAVFTGVSRVHISPADGEYADEDGIFEEKSKLVRTMTGGVAVLNRDNSYSRRLEDEDLGADLLWYGRLPEDRPVESMPPGLYFDELRSSEAGITARVHVSPKGESVIPQSGSCTLSCPILGRHHIYSLLPAVLVGLVAGMDLEQACAALESHSLPPGRLNTIAGIDSSAIIDASWNASPQSVEAALETLAEDFPSRRRIALLGSMLNVGDDDGSIHRAIGETIPGRADLLITVGSEAEAFAEGAKAGGMPEDALRSFESAEDAGSYVRDILQEGDVVLAKGSRYVFLERAIRRFMAHPDQADRVLVGH